MTNEQLEQLLARNPSLAQRNRHLALEAGAEGLPAPKHERDEGKALDHKRPRKAADCPRLEIVFTIYACKPTDWDNWHVKILQDLLVHAGILHGDDWRILEGRVISKKANSESEERTEITITPV